MSNLISISRKLRKNQTLWERKIWSLLRRKEFKHLKFRRQYKIGDYIVDFCCPSKKLVIELDGGGHAEEFQSTLDIERDKFLKQEGFTVLRIWNNEVDHNIEGVFEKIDELTK